MRKYILSIAVAAMAMTASAQTTSKIYDGYKFTDNWYVGINAVSVAHRRTSMPTATSVCTLARTSHQQ